MNDKKNLFSFKPVGSEEVLKTISKKQQRIIKLHYFSQNI